MTLIDLWTIVPLYLSFTTIQARPVQSGSSGSSVDGSRETQVSATGPHASPVSSQANHHAVGPNTLLYRSSEEVTSKSVLSASQSTDSHGDYLKPTRKAKSLAYNHGLDQRRTEMLHRFAADWSATGRGSSDEIQRAMLRKLTPEHKDIIFAGKEPERRILLETMAAHGRKGKRPVWAAGLDPSEEIGVRAVLNQAYPDQHHKHGRLMAELTLEEKKKLALGEDMTLLGRVFDRFHHPDRSTKLRNLTPLEPGAHQPARPQDSSTKPGEQSHQAVSGTQSEGGAGKKAKASKDMGKGKRKLGER